MPETVPELRPVLDADVGDDWTAKATMHGLDGRAIRLEFEYEHRPPGGASGGIHPTENYLEVWWHESNEEYALKGPCITDRYCTEPDDAVRELHRALGETATLVERARIAGTLGSITGIGPATVTRFHKTFGTIENVLAADDDALRRIPRVTPGILRKIDQRTAPRHAIAESDDDQADLAAEWDSA